MQTPATTTANQKQLQRVIKQCIQHSPVQTAEYYHRGYVVRVNRQDGAYIVTTTKGYSDFYYPTKYAATLAEAAYFCDCNEYQGGDTNGWVAAR